MFIPKFGATRQIIQPTVTNLQPVKDAINGMKARYRTNESLPLKPRIEASYAVFKEYIKDLPKDQKAASKQVFVREMSTLLRIDSAPILALLQKKNEVSGPCIEAMVTAKNAQQDLQAELKPSAVNVTADAKGLTPPIGVSAQRKLPTYVAPAEEKRSETLPLPISTAGQNTTRVVKQEEDKLGEELSNTHMLPVADVPGQKGYLGSAAVTSTLQQNLLKSLTVTKQRTHSVDSNVSDN